MAELTFKSAGVSTREIDLSGPTARTPQGVPAGVIGTSLRGPAFVPLTFATYQDFAAIFGPTDGEKFGPLAVNEWMRHANAGAYVRVLGTGDAKKREASDTTNSAGESLLAGGVKNAGFVVGAKLPQANGLLGDNSYAGNTASSAGGVVGDSRNQGITGRSYFLGAFMSASAGSSYFYESNIKPGGDNDGVVYDPYGGSSTVSPVQTVMSTSMPIIRGVLMAPSGVVLSLSCSMAANNRPQLAKAGRGQYGTYANGNDAGLYFGSVITANSGQTFTMLLNGHKNTGEFPQILTASFDPNSPSYFASVFNTDPLQIEKAGHYLYAHWDVYPQYGVVTGSGLTNPSTKLGRGTGTQNEVAAFMLTSSIGRNTATAATKGVSAGIPNFEGYQDRFNHALTPFITSQDFGGKAQDLFRIHALDDGNITGRKIKVSVQNIAKSNSDATDYGSFDLLVRDFYDSDRLPIILERFSSLSLNPSDDRYIARIIGDMNSYYDFDRKQGNQRLVIDGLFPTRSSYIRVEMNSQVANGNAPAKALPIGFRGPQHLVTSGSSIMAPMKLATAAADGMSSATGNAGTNLGDYLNDYVIKNGDITHRLTQPPIPMRANLSTGAPPRNVVDSSLFWGIQFEVNDSRTEPNKTDKFDRSLDSWAKYFPQYSSQKQKPSVGNNPSALDAGGTVLSCDSFCNNRFTLERVQVRTQSNDTPDPKFWSDARYRRNGVLRSDDVSTLVGTSRFLNVEKDFGSLSARKFLKFTCLLQGGFDGLNIFDKQKFEMTNTAVRREMEDTSQGGNFGSTTAAYKKAIDVMEEKSDVDIQLLAIPGLRHEVITDYAIEAMEDRFDSMYIMDIEEKDTYNTVVTSSVTQITNVTNTVGAFTGRSLDSSFAAAYFPDVVIKDPTTKTNVVAPPSVAVLGAFALNDAVAHPWFAPAGFTRGQLKTVLEPQVKLNRDNLDALYDADINPLATFPGAAGVTVWGQKTLQQAQSALDRVNVRRLLIEIRRKVKAVANRILFEPNREDTLAKFAAAVNPILSRIQQQQGVDRFKVIIDTTTTTQADVENNTIRGKIFLQPTRSVEFVSLDFVVTNAGAEL